MVEPSMNKESSEESVVLGRVAKRSGYWALIGLLIGMILNLPFKGIMAAPSDVQGLVLWSWLMISGVGMVFGAFSGLIGKNKNEETEDGIGESLVRHPG